MPAVSTCAAGELDHFIVVQRAQDDHVDLHRHKAGLLRGAYPVQHAGELPPPGDRAEAILFQRIQADVDPAQSCFSQCSRLFTKKRSVGRHRKLLDPGELHQLPDKIDHSPTDQWFPSGEPDLGDADLRCHAYQTHDLFVGEDLLMPAERNPFLGHAITAAQVAPIGYRYAQVVDRTVEAISVQHIHRSSLDLRPIDEDSNDLIVLFEVADICRQLQKSVRPHQRLQPP